MSFEYHCSNKLYQDKLDWIPGKMEGAQSHAVQTLTVLIEAQHGVKKDFSYSMLVSALRVIFKDFTHVFKSGFFPLAALW